MRLLATALFFCGIFATPALAQSPRPSSSPWEVAVGPQVVYREDPGTTHFGGGVTLARRFDRLAIALEGSGTRRDGHNDWRAVAGPRLIFGTDGRPQLFVQALAGALIRSKKSDWAVLPGLGVDVPVGGIRALRLQLDAPIERSEGRTATSVRGSVWFVF